MNTCQWPMGDPTSDDACKCGEPTVTPRSPYCAEHKALAYLPRQPLVKVSPAPRRELRTDYA